MLEASDQNVRSGVHCFEGVHCLMFVAALSGYDQCLVEDKTAVCSISHLDIAKG